MPLIKYNSQRDRFNKKGAIPQELRNKNLSWQKKVQAPRQSMRLFRSKKK